MYKLISVIIVKTVYGEIEALVDFIEDLKRKHIYSSFRCVDLYKIIVVVVAS
jgi:hypothetical protein